MPNGQYRIKRKIASVAVVENGQATIDLPRGYDYEQIGFRLGGTINVTTAYTSVRAEAPMQLIKRIELVADGKNTIDSLPFTFANKNVFRRGQFPQITPPSAASIAAYSVNAGGFLDKALMDGIRPKDSNLRTSGMSLLQLRLTFGAVSDCFVGAGAGNVQNMFVDVFSTEMIELPDAQGNITKPFYLVKRSYQDVAFTSSNANFQIALPVGNIMRGVVIRAEGSSTAGEPSDLVINNIILASGVDVRFNLPANNVRILNQADYDVNTIPTGFYFVDLMTEGGYNVQASEGWDLTAASEAKLTLDVNGGANTKITVMTIELIR